MSVMLGASAGAAESMLMRLLWHSTKVGGIFDFGYQAATILTNDAWSHAARGLPQHCLLVAYPRGLDSPSQAAKIEPEDREVVLLRVTSEAALPNQGDLARLRAEDTDRTITDHYREDGAENHVADELTRNLMQQAAFRCRILGSFVEDDKGDLVFGKDVDAIYAAGGYIVAKPFNESLQLIVDYVESMTPRNDGNETGEQATNADLPETDATMVIGSLRYSSSRRRERIAASRSQSTEVNVRIRPKDFVAHKTAVFGMTRAGKSNTLKVIASAVHLYANKTGATVGQLIFDPAGEYAYANRQDGTALSQLGNVRIYRLGATNSDRAKSIRPLSLNFFDGRQIEGCWSLIESFFEGDTRKYIKNFLASDPTRDPYEPEDHGDRNRLLAVRAMYYGILLNAGLDAPQGWQCLLPANDKTRDKFNLSGGRTIKVGAKKLKEIMPQIARMAANRSTQGDNLEAVKMWVDPTREGGHGDPSIDGLVGMLASTGSANGYKELRSLRSYHSAESHVDFAAAIYGDLARGRLVVVDLSRGSEQVLQTCSDRVVKEILNRASVRFREGHPSRPMQIFLEEAHRLLHRDKFNREATSKDPYVRLAKEAAKYKIGMIYATQEVSSVDETILSNTANWVSAYMNNASELKKLANYYDFADYAGQILNADDPGFVRLRTHSAPFTLPVQIKKFDLDMVNDIRIECGLDPTTYSTDFAPDAVDTSDDFSDCQDPDEIFAELSSRATTEAVLGNGDDLFNGVHE